MKVSGTNYFKLLSYDLSKFFLKNLKKLSPPKRNHILGVRRLQKLGLAIIFNPTAQFFKILKNKGARAKLRILKFWPCNFTFIWFQIKSQILSFALTPPFLKSTESWVVGLKIMTSLNFCCLSHQKILFSLGGDSFLSSSKKTSRGHNLKVLNNTALKPSQIHLLPQLPSIEDKMGGIKRF